LFLQPTLKKTVYFQGGSSVPLQSVFSVITFVAQKLASC